MKFIDNMVNLKIFNNYQLINYTINGNKLIKQYINLSK